MRKTTNTLTSQNQPSSLIRATAVDDATAISKMIIRNVDHFHCDNYTAEELEIWRRGYSIFEVEKQIQNRQSFVLEYDEHIAASIQFDAPEIKGFYVDPKYKGMGFGKTLFNFLLSNLKENGYNHVELTSNKWTVDFYEKFGFEVIGEEIVYWEKHPFTEYRMIKKNR
ncbi:GNAT family N-acetyltransferase [Salibacteraceae bacterium]|jgi:ribosomal protein S18 acetylase RimI-like enzyme|nr:GNAT family N-acetyltransferase [Salibacteraceae bacterium]MDB4105821.1 GNAT family N-acetyltransferase [Salibacteraceae bacterium]MDB9709999.1 GNAT family N-acetyltransferase [Salibacteraceae bacterium]MDC1305169.1 GNAT family N-acetyltransferase [Salibacteraceae bacterium]HAQ71193.1 hypothetical protein [Flavobacteriales bacterium]